MKDREIVESYIKSIREELMMYHDSLSPNAIEYVKKLKKMYNGFEKDLDKLNGNYVTDDNKNQEYVMKDIKDTYVDNNLYEAIDEFIAFKTYHEDYENTNSMEKKNMANQELQHFLNLMTDVFSEIGEHCKDDVEARTMVKNSIKNIYTNFG